MKLQQILLLCAVLTGTAVNAQKKLVCYWFGKMDTGQINPSICTHIIYSFLGVDANGNLNHLDRSEGQALGYIRNLVALRSRRPDLKVIAAVGGYNPGLEGPWSAMAGNANARSNFARNVLNFVRNNNLNGIDIDWEYPNQNGNTGHDKNNFILLLQTLKQTLGSSYSVSVAIGAGEWRTGLSYNVQQMFAAVDFVNVMTYDMHGAWEDKTGIHAALYRSGADNTGANVHDAVQFLMRNGGVKSKLIIGIPSYGNAFNLRNPGNNGVGAPATGAGHMDYRDICQKTRSGALTYRWDDTQKVPYAFSGSYWIGYDDVRSVVEKANYIKNNGYGGGMFWALDDDDYGNACGAGRFPLISAVYNIVVGGGGSPVNPTNPPVNPPPTSPPNPGSFRCPGNGIFKDPANCSKFYNCSNGVAHSVQCGAGLRFNDAIKTCDWDYNVRC